MPHTRKRGTLNRRAAASKFLLGFEGTSLPRELAALLQDGLAGVAIYPRNFASLEGLRALTAQIRQAAAQPVLIGIDQEGGTRFSLPEPFTQWPSPADLGRLNDPTAVERVARTIGRELRAAGVNMNFAPMLDLHVNPASSVTAGRSFGADPEHVARMGAGFIRGLRGAGVLACAKHFPGHGDAQIDPHEELPVFRGTARRLDAMELVPFARAVAEGVPAIMTAHILLPDLEPRRPASLSRKLLHDTLRKRMGFGGVILADDLGMGAIRKRYAPSEAAIEALRAGTDIIMLCHDWALVNPAMRSVLRAVEDGKLDSEEWQASQERIERVRAATGAVETRQGEAPLDAIGCAEHRTLAAEIHQRLQSGRSV